MASLPRRTPIDLAAEDVGSAKCLYFPQNALPGIQLPARLLVEGPGGRRLAGCASRLGAEDETVVFAASQLCEQVAPGASNDLHVRVQISKARWRDLARGIGGWTILKLFAATVVFVGAMLGGAVAFANRETAIGIAAFIFFAVGVGALYKLIGAIRETVDFGR